MLQIDSFIFLDSSSCFDFPVMSRSFILMLVLTLFVKVVATGGEKSAYMPLSSIGDHSEDQPKLRHPRFVVTDEDLPKFEKRNAKPWFWNDDEEEEEEYPSKFNVESVY